MSIRKYHMRAINSNLAIAFLLIALLIGYAATVWPALYGMFLFDDFPNLKNLEIVDGHLDWPHISKYLAEFTGSPGRPLATFSFLINDYAWPSEPFGFKYTNMLLHMLNGVLLFGFLRSLSKATTVLPQNPYWPLLATAAWLFHPLQLSAQMLIVQRMTILSATFCFAGLWAYCALLQSKPRHLREFYALATLGIATLFAFLCKENGALLPIFALVLNTTLLRPVFWQMPTSSRRFVFFACLIPTLAVLFAILWMGIQTDAYHGRDFNLTERIWTQFHVMIDYVRMVAMPSISGSGIYHDDYTIYRSLTNPISTIFFGIAIFGAALLSYFLRIAHPILSFSILWFLTGHVMESSVLPLELYFEHRNYLPLLGPIILFTTIAFNVQTHLHKIAIFLLTLWVCLLIIITGIQAPIWGNQARMASVWAFESPHSLRATQELVRLQIMQRKPQTAFNTLLNAYNRGLIYSDLPISALLLKCYIPAIKTKQDIYVIAKSSVNQSAFTNASIEGLGKLQIAVSKNTCPSIINQQEWLELSNAFLGNSKFPEARIHIERAKLRIAQGNLPLTMLELSAAYEKNPTVELTQKIAELLLSANMKDEAIIWLEKGLKLKQPFFDQIIFDPKNESRKLLHQLGKSAANPSVPINQ